MKMESFDNIQVDVPTCRVILEPGEDYSLEYQLSSAYQLAEIGLRDGTLYFQCRHRWPAALLFWKHAESWVRVTVPAGAKLRRVSVRSVSGEVNIAGLAAETVSVEAVSGAVRLADIDAGELSVRHTSGSVELDGAQAERLTGRSVSGSLRGRNLATGGMDYDTTSGRIELSGAISGQTALQTVSGGVKADVALPSASFSYELSSTTGKKEVNGYPAASHVLPGTPNYLRVRTTSGGIRVNFAE